MPFDIHRWNQEQEWETSIHISDFSWKEVVEPIMNRYVESTDGSFIEPKESALVWHYQDADPDFGSWQAKELSDHLESMLANNPVSVKSGHLIVEVKPQVYNMMFILSISHTPFTYVIFLFKS